ncbi:hypothetical protein [Runella sp.]|jgi:hypothetical protein|uniref:DUF6934 family protein n=1 Tax=Runella sp. TaxID=1960881 RepID=UPI002630C302|nr:hypothetical protein [Runella sp.]
MNETHYSFNQPQIEYRYDFVSISTDKEVHKRVLFTLTETEQVYNLALLDVLSNGETSDIVETKNKDMRIVLATVMRIITDFLDKNPTVIVLFQGSDEKRQRLYRIVINREIETILQQFRIFGSIDNQIEVFESNRSYNFFLIIKR